MDEDILTTKLRAIIEGHRITSDPQLDRLGPTYVALRRQGQIQSAYWCYPSDLNHLWQEIIATFSRRKPDRVELCFSYQHQRIPFKLFDSVFSNIHRGIRGIEIQYRDILVRYSPTRMIATNLSFQRILQTFLEKNDITEGVFVHQGGQIYAFASHQILIQLYPAVLITPLYRGSRIFPISKLSRDEIQVMTSTMAGWLFRQIQEDGRLIYRYHPSQGQESKGNNAIRQFMATLCLIRYAQFSQRLEHQILATHNLNYNLKKFYRQHQDLGLIEHQQKVKLGSLALAALCLLAYQDLVPDSPEIPAYSTIFDSLCHTIDTLWQPDGSFRTFWQPSDRNDNQNFYPGEALLLWTHLYHRTGNKQVLDRCYQSFFYYREWHRQHPNPAFIPWHTQAYAQLYQDTQDHALLAFIFDMNDRLIPFQQVQTALYPDLEGRFYDPDQPEYGPPHASSTGVYLEGLVTALELAIQVGDQTRIKRYHQTVWRGIRSLRQLQFRDLWDLFYISKPDRVQGGVRTTVYNNTIRIDNVQHGLMALMAFNRLPPEFLTFHREYQVIPGNRSSEKLNCFRLIAQDIDVQPLLAEVETQAHLWQRDTSRQDRIKVQQETQTIPLRVACFSLTLGAIKTRDIQASELTPWAERFPLIINWIKIFVDTLGGELGRVSIVRLAPHGQVYRHIDEGEYYRNRDRYHLVLQSSEGSLLEAGEEWVKMGVGEVWWFNNKMPHAAYNRGDQWRIHLIFDVLTSPATRQLG